MLQRVDQGIGSGSVSEWGPASSGVVRSAPVHTTAGIPALVILQYCHPKSCAVFLCSACANNSVKFSVLDELDSVDQARAIFHGASPSVLLASEMDGEDFPVFIEYVNKLMKLLTTLGRLDIVLLSKATEIDSAQFLMSAMKLNDKLPFLPVRVGQCDRLVGSVSISQSYDVWVTTSTHRSRSEAASVYYKMVNLRLPGEAADGLLFGHRLPDAHYSVRILMGR